MTIMATDKLFVVYEVWTRSRLVRAADADHAYEVGDPTVNDDMPNELELCNWHVVQVPDHQVPTSDPLDYIDSLYNRR